MMRSDKDLKALIESGEITVTELSREELNALIDEILDNFDAESIFETELLDKCYEALEASDIISSDRYNKITEEIVDSYNEKHIVPPRRKRMIILVAAAIAMIVSLGGCRFLDFSAIGMGKELIENIKEQNVVSHGNSDLVWTDGTRGYNSVEGLVKGENLTDLVYLKNPPEGFELTLAQYVELGEQDGIIFKYECNDKTIFINVIRNETQNFPEDGFEEIYTAHGIDFCYNTNHPQGANGIFWNYGSDTYTITVTPSDADMIRLVARSLAPYSPDGE